MPDQAIVFMGVVVREEKDIPKGIVPREVAWTTADGKVVRVTPKLALLEDRETGYGLDGEIGGTIYGFQLNGRYYSKIIDKVDPADQNETGDGYLLRLDLEQLVRLRDSVREWFPGAEVIVTTVFH